MNKIEDDDSSDDQEESFRVIRSQKKKSGPGRAVIDSDSDDESFSPDLPGSAHEDSIIEESDIEDSFEATLEASGKALSDNELSKKNSPQKSNSSPPKEKDNWKSEILTDDDFVESSDDEGVNIVAKSAKNTENIIENSDSEGGAIVAKRANNLGTGDIIQNSDDEEEALNSDIIQDSDEEPKNSTSRTENILPIANSTLYRSTIADISDNEESSASSSGAEEASASAIGAEFKAKSLSVVELSSDDEPVPAKLVQKDLSSFIKPSVPFFKQEPQAQQKVVVSRDQYEQQRMKIALVEGDLFKAKRAIRQIQLANLPDRGKSLIDKERSLNEMLQRERLKLANMAANQQPPVGAREKVEVAWEEIEAGVGEVGPRTFGKKGVARFNVERQLAVETLDSIHKSLETCPKEGDFVEDPKGVKVPLMPHQKHAVAWLLWREKQKPSGGLLADDMGLGKTLTMISLILKSREIHPEEGSEKENYRDKYPGGTLVVCPASLMNQWSGEIERRTKRGLLSVEMYHGAKREPKPKRLALHDVVITTYTLVSKDSDKNGPLFGVRWRRIILDEAHQIRNYKSQMAEAAFRLSAKSRWALTGTPVHNKELDMYSILKFLRCAPFDDLQVWKRWMADKSTGGEMRMHAVISSLMKRRTKAELMEKGTLQSLPERTWELISVKLEKDEMDVYQKVLIFSRTLFAQFLHQRAERNQDAYNMKYSGMPPDPNGEYFKMRNKLLKLNRVKDVSQHEILVLLLRLRQICCHPSLIKQMLDGDEDLGDAEDYEESEEMNLLDQLNKLNIHEEEEHQPPAGLSEESVGLKEASKGFLNPSNPVFRSERASSKIRALIKLLKEKVATGDKVIVVSQWTSLLDLIAHHVRDEGISFDSLTGKIQVQKRMPIVDNFNDPKSHTKVLLLSLTAGGVGLNLVGANHLFLLDLHWNPQLESQAQDRIYRMGQNKPIFVYKFMAVDTIEERIKSLQDKKLEIANAMLTGSKRVSDNKLSIQDLKMLFDFK